MAAGDCCFMGLSEKGYVLDHLNKDAFYHYAFRTKCLKTRANRIAFGSFCDSWEVETKHLTTKGFNEKFRKRFHYDLVPYIDSLYSKRMPYAAVRYNYMKLLSEYVIENFYKSFTKKSHELGAYSRVQCSGAPCDIISAYASVDIPESEALLYEPSYSNIVASAAGLSGKRVVTSETFTCLYGWPRDHHSEEQTADLKLLADAIFANGVNQIIWHGKPLNPAGEDTVKFYASVHLGKSGTLAEELPAFNNYLEKVSENLKKGVSVSKVAVYLPTEDAWMEGELPTEEQFIWAWELTNTATAISQKSSKPGDRCGLTQNSLKAEFSNNRLKVGDFSFQACYVDVKYMDLTALQTD